LNILDHYHTQEYLEDSFVSAPALPHMVSPWTPPPPILLILRSVFFLLQSPNCQCSMTGKILQFL